MKSFSQFIIVSIISLSTQLLTYAQSITIESTNYQQLIDMMGGDMERSAKAVQYADNANDIIDWGFKDINFNYCRVQYDKNQELVEGVKNWSFYDKQIITMQKIKAINPDIKFFATMRSDYDGFGNENNAPDWTVNYDTKKIEIDKYVRFLADYLEYMHEHGLTIHTMSITKEWTSFVYASRAKKIISGLHDQCDERNIPRVKISDQGFWSIKQGVNYIDDVAELGSKDLYDSFCSHDYDSRDNTTWETIIGKAAALGKKLYHDEFSTGAGGPSNGDEPEISKPIGVYIEKAKAYEAGLNGEIFFEIWSRGINKETRAIYFPNNGTGRRLRGYYIMKQFADNILDSNYMPSNVSATSNVYTMTFRKENKVVLWVINNASNALDAMPVVLNNSIISSEISNTYWTDDTVIEGATETLTASNNTFFADIKGESMNCFIFNVTDEISPTVPTFDPDPDETYFIDSPEHNLRLAANGESENAYTTSTNVTDEDVQWKFIAKGNDYWHLQRAAGGIKPRLRTDNSINADMQETTSSGAYTYFEIKTTGSGNNYFLTLPDGPSGFNRLQVNPDGEVKMVPSTYSGSWESFTITKAKSTLDDSSIVHITKRNAADFAIDGGRGGENEQNIYLWAENDSNVNQQWIEIDRGGGYYSYQKQNTDFCIDGGSGGANRQNVYLWKCGENNQNQQWEKVAVDGDAFQLVKRNAIGFALDGGSLGANYQNIGLYDATADSQNLHWFITPVGFVATTVQGALESQGISISILPNPVVTDVTVRGAADDLINVYDSGGRLVLTKRISGDNETIDFSGLPPGLYFARVNGAEKSAVFKMVKD